MKCCGADCDTLYCPHCGKRVEQSPITDIINYCRKVARDYEHRAAMHTEYGSKNAPRLKTVADKWKSWADAIEDLEKRATPTIREASE